MISGLDAVREESEDCDELYSLRYSEEQTELSTK